MRVTCPQPQCSQRTGNVIRYGFVRLKRGKRRRYICRSCGKTFCSTTGTPYHRIQRSRNTFDEVCHLSVEGMNKSAIARVERLSWNTVARWLARAAACAKRYNQNMLRRVPVQEIQLDEIRSFLDQKRRPVFVITAIDVWTRMWLSCGLGSRSYRNIRKTFRDVVSRAILAEPLLITTDGFRPYAWVISRLLGPGCVYGQVVKTRRKDRVVRVDRKLVIGTKGSLAAALARSEDSDTLNTAFVERRNLTIRRGCAYL